MNPKQQAAEAAMQFVSSNQVVGLGTGSTADFFLLALAEAIRLGRLTGIRGIPTSVQSERRAGQLGIPISTLAQCPAVDVTVDGADEVTPTLDVIKGLGGALLREKMVAQATAKLIIIADESKAVTALGIKTPLPVEVVPFAHASHVSFLKSIGAIAILRTSADGKTYVTDNGNYIYDCRFEKIDRPAQLQQSLKCRAGVVETGLFVGLAKVALIADGKSVRTLTAPEIVRRSA